MSEAATTTHESSIAQQLQVLTDAVLALVNQAGRRMTREELCQRQGIHRSTLRRRLMQDGSFPRPGPDGKWALADVVAWELKTARSTTPGAPPGRLPLG